MRAQRPGVSRATNKYDEFPLPHGLTRRGLHRVPKQYHILRREVCRSLHQRPALMSAWSGHRSTFEPCPLYRAGLGHRA